MISKQVGSAIRQAINVALGVLFPVDVYGYPKKIQFFVPPSHTLGFITKSISGWNYTGDKINIESGSGDTHIWTLDITLADERKNDTYWMNHEINVNTNQFIFLIAYY